MFNRLFQIYYETPGGASASGAGATPPVADPSAQPTPQPGAPGQGQSQGDGFRTTFFPNVPDEQWNIVAPHLENVNKHVTQLQQTLAPLRGYTPETVQGLANFAQAFDADPVGQWVGLARMLQERGVLDPELDVDHLEALVTGQEIQDPGPAPQPMVPGFDGLPPEAQQYIAQLQQTVQQVQERLDTQDKTSQQRAEDAALARSLTWMRSQLKEAGINEELLTEQRLLASFIAHKGNASAAVKDMSDFRSGMLTGYVQQADQTQAQRRQPLDTSKNGVPPTNTRSGPTRRGMFASVSAGAEQFIRSQDKG